MKTIPPTTDDVRPDASDRGVSLGDDPFAPKPVGYYDQPLLKAPHWEWNVITYLFLGGIMGGSSSIVLLVDENDEEGRIVARNGRYLALALALACPAVLISHLGRPERFLNMLRVLKLKSPMSVGVWGLLAFGNTAGLVAIAQAARDGILPRWLRYVAPRRLSDPPQALFGSFIAGYTGVLISATAIPIWGKGKYHIPAMSVCSGVAGACAVHAALLALTHPEPHRVREKLERLELVASAAELALLESFRRYAGELGAPMFDGARGKKLRTVTELGGIVAPALIHALPVHGRWKTLLTTALTLAGGYVLRETLIESGKDSAGNPKAAFRQPE